MQSRTHTKKDYYLAGVAIVLFMGIFGFFKSSHAQIISTPGYEVLAAPDLWYNEVDGVRVGFRLRGQEPGTFLDGDHRVDFGLWLGTRLPTYPVSYYLSYVDPIGGITEFGSEGSLNLFTSIREGLHSHGAGIEKRWQPGFNEFIYTEASGYITTHYRFEDDYAHYPVLWQDDVVVKALTEVERQTENRFGFSNITGSLAVGLPVDTDFFTQFQASFAQEVNLSRSFTLNGRAFVTTATDDLPIEYYHQSAMAPALNWTQSGFTRSRGTIPNAWMDDGLVHIAGGANLRGYTRQNIDATIDGQPVLYNNITALNFELRYPNIINRLFGEISMLGDFLNLNSYLFYDIGAPFDYEKGFDSTLSDAGAGFMLSLNIPDYVGRQRGFNFRYEIPFWLSDPADGDGPFEFRNLISIGAVIGI
ncbi:MAG: hypothetical protein WEB89_09815 [Balneolales bacterium]